MMQKSREDVCGELDRLLIEMLSLVEQKIQLQVNVEVATKNGSIDLAKTRYIMGQNSVSTIQLPSENSPEFAALSKVRRSKVEDHLQLIESARIEFGSNPIKWFGVLVPQNLHRAQDLFGKALHYVVESLNVQKQLGATCDRISALKSLKDQLTPEE